MTIAAMLADHAVNGALAIAKKPFQCIQKVSLVGVNTVSDVGGYHEVSVGAVKFRTGDDGEIPDKKYVDVTANTSTAVADRCVAALMQQTRAGHVATSPLHEAMTVFKVTYPVLTEQINNPGVTTDYVTTSMSLPNMLRVKYDEAKCGCACLLPGEKAQADGDNPGRVPLLGDDDGTDENSDGIPDLEEISSGDESNGYITNVDVQPLNERQFKIKSKLLANALRYQESLPRDDIGAVQNQILADEIGCTPLELDQIVWSSQGSHDLRFERIDYGSLVTIRAKYKNAKLSGPEFMSTEYNKEAARNITAPDSNGNPKNTLGIFNDLFPGEKYTFSHKREGPDHSPMFYATINYKTFVGEAVASNLQHSKTCAMANLISKMLVPTNEQLPDAILMSNREKKVFRAYNCIGKHKADSELLDLVTTLLRRRPFLAAKEIARTLGTTTKSINQVCYSNSEKFNKVTGGWELSNGSEGGSVYKKMFGRSATASVLANFSELREVVEFHVQVPARYAELALSMTAGNTGVSNISYVGTRFRTVLTDDESIPQADVDVYTNALTLLAFVTRNSSMIPYADVLVDYKGSACLDICLDLGLTIDEKFAMLENEKRSRSGLHVLASYDATNFSGDFESVRTVVIRNPGSTTDVDKPEATYRCAQVAPNYFGIAGPLDTRSPTTWLSAIMRNMSDGEKELCDGVKSAIVKRALKGKARENYLTATKIVAEGDVKCFVKRVKEGKIGSDCQTPPNRISIEKGAELYAIYSDWYDRVGPNKMNNRMCVTLGLIEKVKPEALKTFNKGDEVDDRGRLIQPTRNNDGHTVCNGHVVKIIAETVKLSRPANLFKGLTENGKKCFFGRFRSVAHKAGGALHCFDRSKQDWLTSLMLLESYEDYMQAVSEAMLKAGFDKVANTIFSSKNKATKCTTEEFIIKTEHDWAMLTSACAQTSDANRMKTEIEFLAFLLDNQWSIKDVQGVYDSWNNPEHRDLIFDCDGNEVYVPNDKMIVPMKYEGDDTTTLDLWNIFERDNVAHCVKFAAFNKKYSTSWIPSDAAYEHGPLDPIDTLSVLYFSDHDRDKQNHSTKLPSGRPDFAIPHPVKKAQSLVTMWSPANIKFRDEADNTVNVIMNDFTRIAIVTAKTSQAETMRDLLWLRREATKSAEYFLKEYDSIEYVSTSGPIWDPRDPEARGVAPTYEQPVVQRLVEIDSQMPGCDSSKELLIANAEAWRLTCPELRGVPVATLAAELVALDVHTDEEGITKEDFDIRHSFQRVLSIAPNVAKVCEKKIAKTVGRMTLLGGEGTQQRLQQQKEAVNLLLSVGGKRRNENTVTNEQSSQRRGTGQRTMGPSGSERRGASDQSSDGKSTGASDWTKKYDKSGSSDDTSKETSKKSFWSWGDRAPGGSSSKSRRW